jgi:hypothetical protein
MSWAGYNLDQAFPGAPGAAQGQQATQVPGMLQPGNIDIYNRPIVKNKDGSISTVRSISVEIEGKHYLIPTVAADGSGILSNADAVKQFKATGQHLGMFSSDDAADTYARQLHEQQDRYYNRPKGFNE